MLSGFETWANRLAFVGGNGADILIQEELCLTLSKAGENSPFQEYRRTKGPS